MVGGVINIVTDDVPKQDRLLPILDLLSASSLSEEKIARRALSTDQFPNVHYCVHAEATGALHRVRQDLTVA